MPETAPNAAPPSGKGFGAADRLCLDGWLLLPAAGSKPWYASAMESTPPATPRHATLGDRTLFPTLRATAYLNHAAISPASVAVCEQAEAVLRDYARSGLRGFKRWLPQRGRLKAKLASLIGADARDLGFVPNTTAGVVAVAQSLDWRPGDRVVVFDGEFPANVTPWQRAAASFGLQIVVVDAAPFHRDHEEGLEVLRGVLRDGVRLVAVSQVRFQSGLAMPVEAMGKLCHDHGALLAVDAIQGLGACPLRVDEVDFLSCGAHKWLMGLEGVGFLYVAPRCAEALVPRLAGWLSHENALDFLFLGPGHLRRDRPLRQSADVIEQGAQNVVGLAALEASVDMIAGLGVERIAAHVQRYHDALEPGLLARGFRSRRAPFAAGRSGSLCALPPQAFGVAALAEALADRGVAVTTPDGHLRFAPHWPNDPEREVPIVLGALDEILASPPTSPPRAAR